MAFNARRYDNMAVAAYHLVHSALVAPRQRIQEALALLPVVQKSDLLGAGVDLEEPCPICLVPLSTVFAEGEAAAQARAEKKASAKSNEEKEDDEVEEEVLTGVTKLVGCGHVFCRRDLTQWIRSHHGNCPTCRDTFMDLRPVDYEDDESSDGGEYVPDDFEDEEDDGFLDIDVDGYTDTEGEDFPVETMELDVDAFYPPDADEDGFAAGDSEMGDAPDEFADGGEEYEDEDVDVEFAEEWGLTDGESESMSSSDEGMGLGMGMGMPGGLAGEEAAVPDREVSVSAHEDELDAPFERDAGLSVSADGALANAQEKTRDA
ncbi:hypothetical protein D9619_000312 [Psilocybe cf. subviscida]|uniref:RING-type domain-containing protein n=1 Tax=Psilocybe cf. subviscida TaxID=2480587 RepID=A0A8H5BFI8_9AGAR|nr:hypothetical protein D9619_000312 [Psilocybe cf. subviscida]